MSKYNQINDDDYDENSDHEEFIGPNNKNIINDDELQKAINNSLQIANGPTDDDLQKAIKESIQSDKSNKSNIDDELQLAINESLKYDLEQKSKNAEKDDIDEAIIQQVIKESM